MLSREELQSRDEIFTVLSNRRRRWVLYYLKQHDGHQVTFRTLVDSLSAWEYDQPAEELSWKERKRIYTSLRQVHLPKLADAGIIEYNRSRGIVEPTEDVREVQMYLEFVPADDIPWSQYYLGLTGVALTLLVLTWISVFPFQELSGLHLSGIFVVMLGVSAFVHHYHLRRSRIDTHDFSPP